MKHASLCLAAILTAMLVSLTGCDRKPHLVPAGADSLSANQDSLSILSRMATERWDSGQSEQAAAITARVVRTRIEANTNSPWDVRTRELLDSLGVAAEVEGGAQATVVNLFSRSEVEGGSWPYFFWSEDGSVRVQTLEGRGMRLLDATVRGFTDVGASDSAQLAVVWGRRSGAGQQRSRVLCAVESHRDGLRTPHVCLIPILGSESLGLESLVTNVTRINVTKSHPE